MELRRGLPDGYNPVYTRVYIGRYTTLGMYTPVYHSGYTSYPPWYTRSL